MTKTIKERITELAQLRAEIKTKDEEAKKMQADIMDMQEYEWEHIYDDLGIRVFEKRNAKYTPRDDMVIDLELSHPDNVRRKYVTEWLTEAEKEKYFDRKLSKAYLAVEFI